MQTISHIDGKNIATAAIQTVSLVDTPFSSVPQPLSGCQTWANRDSRPRGSGTDRRVFLRTAHLHHSEPSPLAPWINRLRPVLPNSNP